MTDEEINVEVADKVMGWKDGRHPNADILESGAFSAAFSFAPLTEVSDVWLVVEKMKERGFWFCLNDQHDKSGKIHCQFKTTHGCLEIDGIFNCDDKHFHAVADTAPRAICLAALKALK